MSKTTERHADNWVREAGKVWPSIAALPLGRDEQGLLHIKAVAFARAAFLCYADFWRIGQNERSCMAAWHWPFDWLLPQLARGWRPHDYEDIVPWTILLIEASNYLKRAHELDHPTPPTRKENDGNRTQEPQEGLARRGPAAADRPEDRRAV